MYSGRKDTTNIASSQTSLILSRQYGLEAKDTWMRNKIRGSSFHMWRRPLMLQVNRTWNTCIAFLETGSWSWCQCWPTSSSSCSCSCKCSLQCSPCATRAALGCSCGRMDPLYHPRSSDKAHKPAFDYLCLAYFRCHKSFRTFHLRIFAQPLTFEASCRLSTLAPSANHCPIGILINSKLRILLFWLTLQTDRPLWLVPAFWQVTGSYCTILILRLNVDCAMQ